MRAVLMTAVGGPDVLEVVKVPESEISSEHDVPVRIRAAGINPVDYKLRANGTIGGTLPAILGWDGAGVVESVGSSVGRVQPGDEVYFCDDGFGPTRAPTRRPRSWTSATSPTSPGTSRLPRPPRRLWSPSPPGRPNASGPGSPRAR